MGARLATKANKKGAMMEKGEVPKGKMCSNFRKTRINPRIDC